MSWKENVLPYGLAGGALFGLLFSLGSVNRVYGSRGMDVELEFRMNNQPARLMHEDYILAPDRWWVEGIDGQHHYQQTFVADDGRRITVGLSGYEVQEAVQERRR